MASGTCLPRATACVGRASAGAACVRGRQPADHCPRGLSWGCPAGLRLPRHVPGRSASGRGGASSTAPRGHLYSPASPPGRARRGRLPQTAPPARAMPGSGAAPHAGPRSATGFRVPERNDCTGRPGEGAVGPAQPWAPAPGGPAAATLSLCLAALPTWRGSELGKRPGPGSNTEHVQRPEEVLEVLPCTLAPVRGDSGCKTALLGRWPDTGTQHRLCRRRGTPGNVSGWKSLRLRCAIGNGRAASLPPRQGHSGGGGPSFSLFQTVKPSSPVPRRTPHASGQEKAGGPRAPAHRATHPQRATVPTPLPTSGTQGDGRGPRGAQAGSARHRALPELSKPSCASGPCRQQPEPRKCPA